MKLRHAAALAFLGCTLIYPPYNPRSDALDTNRPLKEWYTVADFGTCAECESRKFQTLKSLESRAVTHGGDARRLALRSARSLALCHSTAK
jgi:hypothetical protein